MPVGSKQAGMSANQVIVISGLMQKRPIIIGDMNLHHTDCNNFTLNPTLQAKELAKWIMDNHAICNLETSTKTHSYSRTLDLVILSSTISHQVIECYVKQRLHITSDHKTLLTCLGVQKAEANKSTIVKF